MDALKRFPLSVVWVLAIQFLLGMYINMYVEFPESVTSTQASWEFARGNIWILAHIVIGLIILLGTINYLVMALKYKQKQVVPYAIIGLIAVLVAVLGGERFVSAGDDLYSMLMATGFIGAIVTYALAARVPVTIKK